MREETKGAFTEAEYEQIAVIRLWLDRYDAWERQTPVADIPHKIAEVARKYRAMLLDALSRERGRMVGRSDFLDRAKKVILEWEAEGGGKIRIERTNEKVVDAEVVDAEREAPSSD